MEANAILTKPTLMRLAILVLPVLAAPWPGHADGPRQYAYAEPMSYDLDDYGVVPLQDAIAHVRDTVDGQIIKIKLDTKKNPSSWKYKTEVLRSDGRVVKIEHNAQSLTVLKYKLKH